MNPGRSTVCSYHGARGRTLYPSNAKSRLKYDRDVEHLGR